MCSGGPRGQLGQFLYELPPATLTEFCRAMDALPDPDWTRFASEVLRNMTDVRLAVRREGRSDWVISRLEDRNEPVGYLLDVLQRLQLLRQRDIILKATSPPHQAEPKHCGAMPTVSTIRLSTTVDEGSGGLGLLPLPAPPPSHLQSGVRQQTQPPPSLPPFPAVMCWSSEEVRTGTEGFSPALQVGRGGFGVVFQATLRNTQCAVKRLTEDGQLDWRLLQESFTTEVEKLATFRHPNIVDLLGFSVGGGSMCLIYGYMENRSLEDQLHNNLLLSWPQRINILTGASAALQFLHRPPGGHMALIHGDVKSSNILLDRHMEAKLSDFGLARFRPAPRRASQTGSVGRTENLRGTMAYLPDEYVRNGELGTSLDVFSFGVVMLEVLTGRRAVENHGTSRQRYLKDLVEELEENQSRSSPDVWRTQVDQRLMAGGEPELSGCLQLAELASKSLDRNRKNRPTMTTVFENLKDIQRLLEESSQSLGPPGLPRTPPQSLDASVGLLIQQLSRLGPGEDTDLSLSSSSASSSSFSLLPRPHPLHCSSSLPPPSSSSSLPPFSSSSSSLPPPSSSSSSSFIGPCETDESRGFSQYFRSNGTSSRSLDPSVPSAGPGPGPGTRGLHPESPGRSLQSTSPGHSVLVNPVMQRQPEKKLCSDDGRIEMPELLSSSELYGGQSEDLQGPECFREPDSRGPEGFQRPDLGGPEESDELEFLPAKRH